MLGVYKVMIVDIIIVEYDGIVVRVDEECFEGNKEDSRVEVGAQWVGDGVDGFRGHKY